LNETFDDLNKIITLRTPLSAGGATVEQIVLVPPRIGQRKKAEAHHARGVTFESMTRFNITLIALVAKVNEGIVEQMDTDQFEEAASFLEGFSSRGRETGKSAA
jgi:hypothetical protein